MRPKKQQPSLARPLYSFFLLLLSIFILCAIFAFGLVLVPKKLGWWYKCGRTVDRSTCEMTCFDGKMKCPHPLGRYKTFYFNMDEMSFKILFVFLTYSTLGILSFQKCARLIFQRLHWHFKGKKDSILPLDNPSLQDTAPSPRARRRTAKGIRVGVFVMYCFTVYPNFYCGWNTLQYLNDRFFAMWSNQLYFTITELLVALCLAPFLDARVPLPRPGWHALPLWTAWAVPLSHILQSAIDQGVNNLLRGRGLRHQVTRDLGFLAGDLVPFLGASLLLGLHRPATYRSRPARTGLLLASAAALGAVVTISFLFPGSD